MSKTKPKYSHEPKRNERLQEIRKRIAKRDADLRAIGYSMCELDVWDVIESLDLPLCTRIKMVERFNEALSVRKVTDFQITENDLNSLV